MAPNSSLPIWGNEKTMNLNHLILTNIQSSPYFKVNLFGLKTYHEVIDEIYYKVSHLEAWEKGSRKTAGQTGMCGGELISKRMERGLNRSLEVRGVGAGGIVSSAYCLLYKLFTLKLTRKQVNGLITHNDSPYIRGLGFMYIRYTQPPADLWEWYEPYMDDEEEVDVKAGGGCIMKIGEMLKQWLTKLEWFSTLFPRVPVPIQKMIDMKMKQIGYTGAPQVPQQEEEEPQQQQQHVPTDDFGFGEAERQSKIRNDVPEKHGGQERRSRSQDRRRSPPIRSRRTPPRRQRSPDDISRAIEREKMRQEREKDRSGGRPREKHRSRSRERERRRSPQERRRSRSPHDRKRSGSKEKHRSSKERRRSRSREKHGSRSHDHGRHRHSHDHKHEGEETHEKHRHKHKKSKDKDRHRNGEEREIR